jgi:hypothetical protein
MLSLGAPLPSPACHSAVEPGSCCWRRLLPRVLGGLAPLVTGGRKEAAGSSPSSPAAAAAATAPTLTKKGKQPTTRPWRLGCNGGGRTPARTGLAVAAAVSVNGMQRRAQLREVSGHDSSVRSSAQASRAARKRTFVSFPRSQEREGNLHGSELVGPSYQT